LSEPQFGQYIKDSRLDKTITITKTGLFLTLYSGKEELKAGETKRRAMSVNGSQHSPQPLVG